MKFRCVVPVCAVLFVVSSAAAATATAPAIPEFRRRAITHEDVWLAKRVGSPMPSPDGKSAVFLVTEPAYDQKDQTADLWIVPVNGSQVPRQLTRTKAPETGVSWSPDGTKIAFSTKREGDELAQIYVMDLARGGEAERVTLLSTGARAPQWSSDGTRLMFISDVYPKAADDEANKKAAKAIKDRKYNA